MHVVKEGEEGNTFFSVVGRSPVDFSNMALSFFTAAAEKLKMSTTIQV